MSFIQELKRRNVFRVGIAYTLAAWILLQIVDFATQVIEAPGWILQFSTLIAVLGLPIALIFSWVFEMTPEGIKRESEIDRSYSVTAHTSRKLGHLIVVFLALAVIFLLADKFFLDQRPAPVSEQQADQTLIPRPPAIKAEATAVAEQSIAVLPFVNMSSDPDQEYFSDGISEEILNVLTHIPNLKVAARTSSFQFKGQHQDISTIGLQLQVAHILEGSVRTAGDRVRITAQLIQVSDGFHLWSRTFDRQMEDVFAIQDEIAAAIASELRATFTSNTAPLAIPVGLDVYQQYLKGRALVAARGEKSLLQSIKHLKAALTIDAAYTPAMASLSVAYAVLPWYSAEVHPREARSMARIWAEKALEIDPDNVEAMAALGVTLYQLDLDWNGADKLFKRALEIGPGNATANNFYGDFLTRTCDLERALIYESRAAELDPLAAVQWGDLANLYSVAGQPRKALQFAQRAVDMDVGGIFYATQVLMRSHYELGDLASMRKVLEDSRASGQFSDVFLNLLELPIHIAGGELELAQEIINKEVAKARSGKIPPGGISLSAAWAGDYDAASELLSQGLATGDGTWQFPALIRLPEQAPDNKAWQEFWSQPGVAELAEIRRSHGFSAHITRFGELKQP